MVGRLPGAVATTSRRSPHRGRAGQVRAQQQGAIMTTGSMRAIDDERGAVRVEDVYDTDIEDLWQACTDPSRLKRWLADVSGDLRVGGTVHATFTSTWS